MKLSGPKLEEIPRSIRIIRETFVIPLPEPIPSRPATFLLDVPIHSTRFRSRYAFSPSFELSFHRFTFAFVHPSDRNYFPFRCFRAQILTFKGISRE
jgi:hypothetical protein